jgi:hypothetical protein
MKKGVSWLFALSVGLLSLLAPACARAGEFCPARIVHVYGVTGAPAVYAVRVAAASSRNVTGAFVIETNTGWYRAPFKPVALQKHESAIDSPPLYLQMPKALTLMNVWLAQAASDDPLWATHGIVSCAPAPERLVPTASIPKPPQNAVVVSAVAIAPPLIYNCSTPFANAKMDASNFDGADLGVGDYVTAEVDLDANGTPVDVTALDASGDDFNLKKTIADRAKRMRFTPAVAYCRRVPSRYILHEAGLQ